MKNSYTLCCLFVVCLLFISGKASAQKSSFKAVNDTVDLVPGIPTTIDLMANDVFSVLDTFTIIGGYPHYSGGITQMIKTGLSTFTYTASPGFNGTCYGTYILRRMNSATFDTSSARILFRFHDHSYDSLYINNVKARFYASGENFANHDSIAGFEVPKFSGKSTIFINTFWMGGLSADNTLYLAAEMYGQGPNNGPAWTKKDFWAGPIMDSAAYSMYTDSTWNYIWNLKKSEVEYHKAHWNQTGYQPIHDILTWPGNGNVTLGQASLLAPYFDYNGDGKYNALDGDYPLIKGDQSLFFIFNDDRNIHSETQGNKMKVEIHAMAYAFDLPNDSAFKNTIFMNFQVFNRSQRTYHNTYIGSFTDFDIGYFGDDYVGCDVQRGSFFGYNGTPVDGSGQPSAYGAHPPAQAVTILGGPYMDPDGIDNPAKDSTGKQLCNESVNGLNFGDSIVDNERMGLRKFLLAYNPYPNSWGEGLTASDYYKLLQGIWTDSTRMIYGGNAYNSAGGAYGPVCDFMFPGMSDTLHWGTGCMPPNGMQNWTEATAGDSPGDRRVVGSMGPFTFHPGDKQDVDLAFVFARDYSGTPWSSVDKLDSMIDIIRAAYKSNKLPNGESFNGISDNTKVAPATIKLYPNPAINNVTVDFGHYINETVHIQIVNSNGIIVSSFDSNPGGRKMALSTSSYPAGLYLVTFRSKNIFSTKKLSIIR